MKIHITGRHLRLTKAITEYVEEKVAKAQKYFNHIVWAQVLLVVEKRSHQTEIVIHASRQTFRALAKGADLYAAIDLASDKIDSHLAVPGLFGLVPFCLAALDLAALDLAAFDPDQGH